MLRKTLRFLGLFLAALVLVVWASLGAHTGWTKTSVTVTRIDPVTEIEYFEREDKFVPGVEFLGAGLAGAAVLTLLSFLPIPSQRSKP